MTSKTVSVFRKSSCFSLTAAIVILMFSCNPKKPPKTALIGGEVHGFVAAEFKGEQIATAVVAPIHIRLPNITVFLKNLVTGTTGPHVKTNAHGLYLLPRHAPGRYQMCLEAPGFVSACDSTPISLSNETFSTPKDAIIQPEPGVVLGAVRLKDGTACYHENAFFTRLQTTEVSVRDSRGSVVAGPVTANSVGQYVLPKIPGAGSYNLSATCAGASAQDAVSLSASDLAGGHAFNLSLDSSAPQLLSLFATIGGKAVRTAGPGETVEVKATAFDPDHDVLHYQWGDSTSEFVSRDSSTISWTLPKIPGVNILFVEVTDKKGGFANGKISITTGGTEVYFGGTVSELAGKPAIAGAQVNLNGKDVKTDADGNFGVRVSPDTRYVLNIEKPGYALLSQVFYSGNSAMDLRLSRIQQTTIDAGTGGVAIFERRNGISTVSIDPGTLVDKYGKPVSGPVHVNMFAYDVNQANPIPGDYSGKDERGNDVRLETYGALDITPTDPGGQPLQLASGAEAKISIVLDPASMPSAPATIPLLTYEQKTGYWKQEGTLHLVGNHYEGRVKHFSQFNADTVFTDTACVKMAVADTPASGVIPARFAPPFPFKLHVSYATGGGPRHNDFTVTEVLNGLFRLPPNTDVTLEIHPNSGPDAVIRSFHVNSGAAISNAFNGFPPLPYDACHGFDPSSPAPGQPVFLAVELPAHSMPYLSFKGSGSVDEAIAYYNANAGVTATANAGHTNIASCTGQKCNLAGWKTANHFDGTEPAVAYYYNGGDLGLGREMHCRANGADMACYVTNYTGACGAPGCPSDPAIADAILHNNPVATVAMEYSHAATPGSGVKFYVYFHATGDSLAPQAVLDSEGPKNVPHLCIQCHGGDYQNATHTITNASFLPFDVQFFAFNPAVGVTQSGQEEQFRQLNSLIASTNPNSADATNNPIGNLINGFYPCGVNAVGCTFNNSYVPPPPNPGWAGHTNLYEKIPKVYCRTCHVADNNGIDWTQYTMFSNNFGSAPPGYKDSIKPAACTAGAHYMPHAEVPFKKFWFSTDPHGPAYLADPGTGISLSGGCPP